MSSYCSVIEAKTVYSDDCEKWKTPQGQNFKKADNDVLMEVFEVLLKWDQEFSGKNRGFEDEKSL